MLNHAHLLMHEGNYELAINLYQACLERQPQNLEIHMYLGKAHFKRQNFAECKTITTKLMLRYP